MRYENVEITYRYKSNLLFVSLLDLETEDLSGQMGVLKDEKYITVTHINNM